MNFLSGWFVNVSIFALLHGTSDFFFLVVMEECLVNLVGVLLHVLTSLSELLLLDLIKSKHVFDDFARDHHQS